MHEEKHPIDIHIGHRVRARRKELKLSQGDLGEAIGVTFQQVQKYERGANRLSGSMIWECARALRVEPGFFFEGFPENFKTEPSQERELREFSGTAAGRALLDAARHLPLGAVEGHTRAMEATVDALAMFDEAPPARAAGFAAGITHA